ncbi:MAG TPA: ABC transporter permease [Anaerolineaceae bacterium]|nr:ABC transporter permease [Anaerolineaceae bacterium]
MQDNPTAQTVVVTRPKRMASFWQRLSTFFYLRPGLMLAALLGPPMIYMTVVYLGSLAALLLNSFFTLDDYTGQVIRQLSLHTYAQLFTPAHIDIALRTASMAAAVTLACAALAFPLAYFMARYASPRQKAFFYLAVLLPLWSSYLIRVYAWRLILAKEGIISWLFAQTGLSWLLDGLLRLPVIGGPSLTVSQIGMFIVFVYVWIPYMILPIQAALERVPPSLLEASADLGARPATTFRQVTLPLAFPGVVAGSIFTFSLTLGDFVVPEMMGNSSYFIGQTVLSLQGTSGNIPLAAAFTMVPIVIMLLYLSGARQLGAFDAL